MRSELNRALAILDATTLHGQDLECDPSNLAAAGPKLAAPLLKRCLWLRVGGNQIRKLTQRISAIARPHQLFSRLCLRQALMKNTAA